ncbi:MAG: citrate lyase acyl carrier protein [Clostridia bacterium]|nr:citrate lyase acyl carrier protein [Clostridia bacterium]
MELKASTAGTLESGDIFVEINPTNEGGIVIELNSTVNFQFGKRIKKVINDTLAETGITNAVVVATDKGALDCTVRARIEAAAVRAGADCKFEKKEG